MYLEQVVAAGGAPQGSIKKVCAFLEAIKRDPDKEFVPSAN